MVNLSQKFAYPGDRIELHGNKGGTLEKQAKQASFFVSIARKEVNIKKLDSFKQFKYLLNL